MGESRYVGSRIACEREPAGKPADLDGSPDLVRQSLLPALKAIFRDRQRGDSERTLAAGILADYAADSPDLLADLLADAVFKHFRKSSSRSAAWKYWQVDNVGAGQTLGGCPVRGSLPCSWSLLRRRREAIAGDDACQRSRPTTSRTAKNGLRVGKRIWRSRCCCWARRTRLGVCCDTPRTQMREAQLVHRLCTLGCRPSCHLSRRLDEEKNVSVRVANPRLNSSVLSFAGRRSQRCGAEGLDDVPR